MNIYTSLDPTTLEQTEVHRCLLAAVAPRPICFASTIDGDGNVNLSPFSFYNVFSTKPPMLIFSPARRASDGTTKHSLENATEVAEVVINLVNHNMVEQMSLSSGAFPKGVNEFKKAGLTAVESKRVKPPRVGESPVSFECVVERIIPLGTAAGAGNLIFCKIVLMHLQNEYLDHQGHLDTNALDLVGRMGGDFYVRSSGNALFELKKPPAPHGIGVDNLPKSIRLSRILTGNDLGRLGQETKLPPAEEFAELKSAELIQKICSRGDRKNQQQKLHRLAQQILKKGETEEALRVLMFADQL